MLLWPETTTLVSEGGTPRAEVCSWWCHKPHAGNIKMCTAVQHQNLLLGNPSNTKKKKKLWRKKQCRARVNSVGQINVGLAIQSNTLTAGQVPCCQICTPAAPGHQVILLGPAQVYTPARGDSPWVALLYQDSASVQCFPYLLHPPSPHA